MATRQLIEAGVSRNEVRQRVAIGWLVPIHRGVYLVGPLRSPLTEPMHVTVVGRDARGPAEITVHRVDDLDPTDATTRDGIPVTSPARTLLDLATQISAKHLARATDEARVHRLVTDLSLNEQFQRYPHHRGTAALRKPPDRAKADEIGSGATVPRAGQSGRTPRTRSQRTTRPIRSRLPLARAEPRRRGRRLRLPLIAQFVRARPPARRGRWPRKRIRVLRVTWRQIQHEREALVATLALATARP